MKIFLGVKLIHPPGVLIVSIFLFVLSVFLIGQNLDKPFWGEHDWNGVRYGNIARNYLRYGLIETKLGQVENSGNVSKEEFEYFTHYPPLLPLSIVFSYRLFGISEASTRLVPLIFTSLSIVLIFLIGSKLWDLRIGVMAGVMVLATPMVLYFGKNPVHEPMVVFFVLLFFYGYLKEHKKIFLLGLILAQLSTWVGFFLIPAITLVELLRKNYDKVKKTLPYWGLSVILFLSYLLYIKVLTGDFFGGDLFGALLQRSGISESGAIVGLDLISYVNKLRLWLSTLYTNTLLGLVFLWLISRVKGFKDQDYSIITLGIFGILYFIFFPNAAFIHNYLVFYLLPFFALAAVKGLEFMGSLKLFSKVYPLLILFVFISLIFERFSFLKALEESNADKLAVEVGKAITQQTNRTDVVLVSPLKFSYSADNFIKFYSDREILYSDTDNENYDVKVIVDQQNGKFEIIKKR